MRRRVAGSARAKINLGLRILGKRTDGFHDIRSIFHSVTLEDRIRLETGPRGGISLEVAGADLETGEGNLAWRAAALFRQAAGLSCSVQVLLEKRIPVAAGLGGGSSDAACVLRLMREATGIDPGLMDLASELGSDVPFLLEGGAALAEGRGERLTPIRPGDFHAVLVNPGISSSTATAYADWDASEASLTSGREESDLRLPELTWHEGRPFPVSLCNDFLPLLAERCPVVAEISGWLDGRASAWGMSGSGPTFYALFRTASEADAFGARVPGRFSPVVCRAACAAGVSSNW